LSGVRFPVGLPLSGVGEMSIDILGIVSKRYIAASTRSEIEFESQLLHQQLIKQTYECSRPHEGNVC
jgi:hypothetical protein